jgi:hypothetical protein
LEEYIFLMLHPCWRSKRSRSACVTRTAYATPLVSGRSNAVLSAYLAKVACARERTQLVDWIPPGKEEDDEIGGYLVDC